MSLEFIRRVFTGRVVLFPHEILESQRIHDITKVYLARRLALICYTGIFSFFYTIFGIIYLLLYLNLETGNDDAPKIIPLFAAFIVIVSVIEGLLLFILGDH